MSLTQEVLNLAKQFTENFRYVTIDPKKLKEVAQVIKQNLPPEKSWGSPKIPMPYSAVSEKPSIILYELIANSINYAYWYGKADIRPNGSDANKMYKTLTETFNVITPPIGTLTDVYCRSIINEFICRLSLERFPMMNERAANLSELKSSLYAIYATFSNEQPCGARIFCEDMGKSIDQGTATLDGWMAKLIGIFPGYGNDMFLKRASLFFMMLYRKMGWFKEDMKNLHIPADYQIPKILRYLGVIKYGPQLADDVRDGVLIPAGSRQEIEIRAATIVAAQKISEEANITTVQIDDYLWLNRKMTTDPFHLTYTTDY